MADPTVRDYHSWGNNVLGHRPRICVCTGAPLLKLQYSARPKLCASKPEELLLAVVDLCPLIFLMVPGAGNDEVGSSGRLVNDGMSSYVRVCGVKALSKTRIGLYSEDHSLVVLYLQVAAGSIVVIIVAESKLIEDQATEFFFFAGFVTFTALIFFFMSRVVQADHHTLTYRFNLLLD